MWRSMRSRVASRLLRVGAWIGAGLLPVLAFAFVAWSFSECGEAVVVATIVPRPGADPRCVSSALEEWAPRSGNVLRAGRLMRRVGRPTPEWDWRSSPEGHKTEISVVLRWSGTHRALGADTDTRDALTAIASRCAVDGRWQLQDCGSVRRVFSCAVLEESVPP